MPSLYGYLKEQIIDVSTLKELCRRWAPDVAASFTKDSNHRALDGGINGLRFRPCRSRVVEIDALLHERGV